MYEIIREKHSDIPYLIISKPDFVYRSEDASRRRSVILDTYTYAVNNGDKNVYFIDGSSMFRGRDWDNCFIDTVHPNDLGFVKMADCMEPIITSALELITV